MKSASGELLRDNTSRMEIVREEAKKECWCEWLERATELLRYNHIEPEEFGNQLRELLERGRGKFRNMMLIGRSNCGKTFMLKLLKCLFGERVFENPSNDKFAWVGAESADVILLQDIRYSRDIITWKDLLLLLEGEKVKLPAPKNHFISDVVIDSDVPIFATGKDKIVYKGAYNTDDSRETEMMNSRWRYIEFTHVFQKEDQKDIRPCGTCFAKLVLMGEEL